MPGIWQILTVGAGGALGAICRYLLQHCTASNLHYRWTVVGINLIGCALIGAAWAIAHRHGISLWLNQWLIAGVLGGFTTYSTFAWDSFDLMRQGRISEGSLYIAATVAGGFVVCAIAFNLTEKLLK